MPESFVANLDGDRVYATPIVRSQLASDSSATAAAKRSCKHSKKSSNKKGKKTCTLSNVDNGDSFANMATRYTNRCNMANGHQSANDEPKSKMVTAAEDAAALSTYLNICVDNFGTRVFSAWSYKDSCKAFLKPLTPAKRSEPAKVFVQGGDANKLKYVCVCLGIFYGFKVISFQINVIECVYIFQQIASLLSYGVEGTVDGSLCGSLVGPTYSFCRK